MGILADEESGNISTCNNLKGYTPVQFIFGHNIILRIKHNVDWELIGQINQMQNNYDNNQKNGKIIIWIKLVTSSFL